MYTLKDHFKAIYMRLEVNTQRDFLTRLGVQQDPGMSHPPLPGDVTQASTP